MGTIRITGSLPGSYYDEDHQFKTGEMREACMNVPGVTSAAAVLTANEESESGLCDFLIEADSIGDIEQIAGAVEASIVINVEDVSDIEVTYETDRTMPQSIQRLYEQLDSARAAGDTRLAAEIEEALANQQA